MRKNDRRNKYTEMVIKQVLFQLLETKPIEKITVAEICRLADINRSTFYLHYMDSYHVLEKAQEEFCDKLIENLEANKNEDELSMILSMHKIIRKDHELYLLLIRSGNPAHAFKKFIDYAKDFMVTIFKDKYQYTDEEAEWIAYFINAACLSVSLRYAHEMNDNIKRERLYTEFISSGLEAIANHHKNSHKQEPGLL